MHGRGRHAGIAPEPPSAICWGCLIPNHVCIYTTYHPLTLHCQVQACSLHGLSCPGAGCASPTPSQREFMAALRLSPPCANAHAHLSGNHHQQTKLPSWPWPWPYAQKDQSVTHEALATAESPPPWGTPPWPLTARSHQQSGTPLCTPAACTDPLAHDRTPGRVHTALTTAVPCLLPSSGLPNPSNNTTTRDNVAASKGA